MTRIIQKDDLQMEERNIAVESSKNTKTGKE